MFAKEGRRNYITVNDLIEIQGYLGSVFRVVSKSVGRHLDEDFTTSTDVVYTGEDVDGYDVYVTAYDEDVRLVAKAAHAEDYLNNNPRAMYSGGATERHKRDMQDILEDCLETSSRYDEARLRRDVDTQLDKLSDILMLDAMLGESDKRKTQRKYILKELETLSVRLSVGMDVR